MSHELTITADNFGQIVNGDNNVVTMTIHGDYIVNPDHPAAPRALAVPIHIRPKSFPGLLDRTAEREEMLGAMARNATVELCGEPGQGKTALLRYLSHSCSGAYCADGIIYVDGDDRPLDDILQFIYDAFYECDVRYKPTEPELLRALQKKRALIVIDNLHATDEEFREFANKIPDATFLVASNTGCLVQEVDTVDLKGLPFDDALVLLERELNRQVSPDELPAAKSLWTVCKGKPAVLVAVANDVERTSGTLVAAVAQVDTAAPVQSVAEQAVKSSSGDDKRILALLAFLGGSPIAANHLAGILNLGGLETSLQSLVDRKLIEKAEDGYRLPGAFVEAFREKLDHAGAAEQALEYFVRRIGWEWPEFNEDEGPQSASEAPLHAATPRLDAARRKDSNPLTLLPDTAAILRVIEWGISAQKWKQVMAIIPGLDGALTLAGRWDVRSRVIDMALKAAEGAENVAAKAWALHQRGSLAMCRGDIRSARSSLAEALDLRRRLRDRSAVEVTDHNLQRLIVPPTVTASTAGKKLRWAAAGGALAVIGLLVFLLWPATASLPAPVNLHAAWMLDTGSVRLAWLDKADREEGFQLERRSPEGQFKRLAVLGPNITGYIDKNIRPGASYIYRVRAFAGAGKDVSAYSNPDTVSVPQPAPPVSPGPGPIDSIPPDPVPPTPPGTPREATSTTPAPPVPAAVVLQSIALDSVVVHGESAFGATITLSRAPDAPTAVSLSTDQPRLIGLPASVVIARGRRTGRVMLRTASVKTGTRARISAALGDTTRWAMLAILPAPVVQSPPRLIRMGADPNMLTYAPQMTVLGLVAIDKPAPAGGMRVELLLTSPYLTPMQPYIVVIPQGKTFEKFQIVTTPAARSAAATRRAASPKVLVTARDPASNQILTDTLTLVPKPPATKDTVKLVRPDIKRLQRSTVPRVVPR